MSLINFDTEFKDMEGEVIKQPSGKNATLRGAAVDALLAQFQDEQNLSGEEKLKRWTLAKHIVKSKDAPCEVTAEDISLIKKLIAKAYGALVVGQAWEILEGK